MIIIWKFARVLWRLLTAIVSLTHAVHIHFNACDIFRLQIIWSAKGLCCWHAFDQRAPLINKGPFYSPSGFNSDCDNSSRLQRVLNLPQSPRTKWSFEAEIVPLLSFYNEVTHLFYWCVLLFMATRKIYFKEKKIWVVEVACFRYEWQETPHLEPQWSMR